MDDEVDEVEDEEEGRTVSDKVVVIGRDSEESTRAVDVDKAIESVRLLVVERSDEVLLARVDVGRAIETDDVVIGGRLDEVLLVTLDEETRESDEVAIVDSCDVMFEAVEESVIDGSEEDELTEFDILEVLVKDGSDEPVPSESDIIYDDPVPTETDDLDEESPVPLGKIGVKDPVPTDGKGVLKKPLEKTDEVELPGYDRVLVRIVDPVPGSPVTEEKRDVGRTLPVPPLENEMG